MQFKSTRNANRQKYMCPSQKVKVSMKYPKLTSILKLAAKDFKRDDDTDVHDQR